MSVAGYYYDSARAAWSVPTKSLCKIYLLLSRCSIIFSNSPPSLKNRIAFFFLPLVWVVLQQMNPFPSPKLEPHTPVSAHAYVFFANAYCILSSFDKHPTTINFLFVGCNILEQFCLLLERISFFAFCSPLRNGTGKKTKQFWSSAYRSMTKMILFVDGEKNDISFVASAGVVVVAYSLLKIASFLFQFSR